MPQSLPPYSPRWLSRSFELLNSLPIPFWVLALAYVVVLAIVRHWIAWERGLLAQGQVNSFLIINPVFSLAVIVAWQYTDRRAERALRQFFDGRPNAHRLTLQTTKDFLSLAPVPAFLLFFLGGAFGYFGFLDGPAKLDPQAAQVWPAISILGYGLTVGLSLLLVYRLLHQIKMMRRLLSTVDADIFNPQPVYALSNYGAAFAIAFVIAYTVPSLPLWQFVTTFSGLFFGALTSISLLIIFFVPLAEINSRMRSNKEQLLAEIGNDLRDVQGRIHTAVTKRQFSEVDKMRGTLTALRETRDLIQKTPTWPWRPETLRNLLTPFIIPVIVFLITRLLGGVLGLQ